MLLILELRLHDARDTEFLHNVTISSPHATTIKPKHRSLRRYATRLGPDDTHGMPAKPKKPRATRAARNAENSQATSSLPQTLQQQCLNIFKDALWTSAEDLETLQEVKGHLYNREFALAFGRPEYLRAYALRWSASRAIGYGSIFQDIRDRILQSVAHGPIRVLSLGGGAGAEMVGLAAWLALSSNDERLVSATPSPSVSIHAVDVAHWHDVVQKLRHSIVTAPKLSAYASAAAKERSQALLEEDKFVSTFTCADVLQWDQAAVKSALSDTNLVTIMFTLNELYASSVPRTQRLLAMITEAAEKATLLLVVDSPGSYSTVTLNGAERRYPMQWLLDHTLLNEDQTKWTKLVSEESQWCRLPDNLQYPVDLENMRYQIHLYRRCGE